ncbi:MULTISPECIES: hypothetical protein [Sphingomonas]|jgi:hypothetical protein|uniref:Uncharacterized protein n=1 Tax=Sphingomonas zeae TaxID=1646122 RepID=A0A7Y6B2Q2_9SPHN|nr:MULTISPECIES: hypothetical protein [Sphingomonas]MBB4049961.1 hypothetical protein [Sphingomonas zeae]MDK8187639.1 hypothetical protein [Sphingomonas zeae]MDK8217399.1 hypothetical protein [Sphingomonas sp. UMB7805-LC452B]NUU45885.1 hypothetical protein [Sphingomonas zeae]
MHLLLLPALLFASAAEAAVPIGHFQTWLPSSRAPMAFTSGGVTVEVAPLPCPAHPVGDGGCSGDGYNNQARVTVQATGVEPMSVTTDRQSGYARIAVVRFGRSDPRPGVIVESQSGGSAGALSMQFLVPSGAGYRVLPLPQTPDHPLQGQIADEPRDLSGDGYIDLTLEDGAFGNAFGCNACTPRPPRVFAVKQGRVVDESRDPALRPVFAADMARLEPRCLSTQTYRNGACAAYVADAARAGRFKAAWARMLAHYERGGAVWQPDKGRRFKDFPESLRAFLIRTGYWPH